MSDTSTPSDGLGSEGASNEARQDPRPSRTLGAAERIRRRSEFELIYKHGTKAGGRFMTIFLLRNGRPISRLGVAATRKLGGAVVRNRAKRLVRDIYRRHKPGPGLDLVVVPRREFLTVGLASLEADYQSIVSRRAGRAPSPPPASHR
jgi:ribonuclease P protein component